MEIVFLNIPNVQLYSSDAKPAVVIALDDDNNIYIYIYFQLDMWPKYLTLQDCSRFVYWLVMIAFSSCKPVLDLVESDVRESFC